MIPFTLTGNPGIPPMNHPMLMHVSGMDPIAFTPAQPAWIFWIFLGCFLLVALVQVFYHNWCVSYIKAVFSRRIFYQVGREGNPSPGWICFSLSLLYILLFSMLIYQVLLMAGDMAYPGIHGIRLYLIICLALVIFWAAKILLMNFIAIVFNTGHVTYEYTLNILIHLGFISVILLPLLVLGIYLNIPWCYYIAGIMVCILIIIRIIRGFFLGISLSRFSYFYLFVYLCTLEILPVLVISKVILMYR